MKKYLFLYKENNTDDRDAIKYIDVSRIDKLECGHYFPSIDVKGACFSQSLELNEIDFNNITSILNKDEFAKLDEYNKNINSLGYGLDTQPQKQEQAHIFYKDIENIIDKLKSDENLALFEKLKEEEKEIIYQQYDITPEETQKIFDNYDLDYQDRAVIDAVYQDYYDLGECSLDWCIDEKIPEFIQDCIDFEKLGEKIADDGDYYILEDGRVVALNCWNAI